MRRCADETLKSPSLSRRTAWALALHVEDENLELIGDAARSVAVAALAGHERLESATAMQREPRLDRFGGDANGAAVWGLPIGLGLLGEGFFELAATKVAMDEIAEDGDAEEGDVAAVIVASIGVNHVVLLWASLPRSGVRMGGSNFGGGNSVGWGTGLGRGDGRGNDLGERALGGHRSRAVCVGQLGGGHFDLSLQASLVETSGAKQFL
jgi:hypothetical protein